MIKKTTFKTRNQPRYSSFQNLYRLPSLTKQDTQRLETLLELAGSLLFELLCSLGSSHRNLISALSSRTEISGGKLYFPAPLEVCLDTTLNSIRLD